MLGIFQKDDTAILRRGLVVKIAPDFELSLEEETKGRFVDYDKKHNDHIWVELTLENNQKIVINSHEMYWGVELE